MCFYHCVGTATPRPATAPARVKPEAQEIASLSKGKRMCVIVHEYGTHEPTPREPRVKSEAKETAEIAKVLNNVVFVE